MTLNKATGNMFKFVSHTWNPMGGVCFHNCSYCYVKRNLAKPVLKEKYSGIPRIVGNAWSRHGNDGKVIFTEDMGDLFAHDVPPALIEQVARFAWANDKNTYLFLTKNPRKLPYILAEELLCDYNRNMPWPSLIFGTTIESSVGLLGCNAPGPSMRIEDLLAFKKLCAIDHPKRKIKFFLSFEPIMQFDGRIMREYIRTIKPNFIAIGADSDPDVNHLPEPNPEDVKDFATWAGAEYGTGLRVYLKPNLARIVGKDWMEGFEKIEALKDVA